MENQFQILQPWVVQILGAIKKEIKGDHLFKNPLFYRIHFGNRPQNRLTNEEICAAYAKELLEGNEELAEWVSHQWIFKRGEIYRHFVAHLSAISPHFDAIEQLTEEESERILAGAIESFGATTTYIFSVLNGVVFPKEIFQKLRQRAEEEQVQELAPPESANQEMTFEQHQRELSRLREKYEDKISGILKKYTTDVEALKRQIRSLQQQLLSK